MSASPRRLASIRCGMAAVKEHLYCEPRPSTTQAMPDTSIPSLVSCGLWDEAIAPETTERVVPTGAEPARHAELEHEPELAVFENLVTIAHKSPNAANEPRANGIAVCESGDRRERTRFAC